MDGRHAEQAVLVGKNSPTHLGDRGNHAAIAPEHLVRKSDEKAVWASRLGGEAQSARNQFFRGVGIEGAERNEGGRGRLAIS